MPNTTEGLRHHGELTRVADGLTEAYTLDHMVGIKKKECWPFPLALKNMTTKYSSAADLEGQVAKAPQRRCHLKWEVDLAALKMSSQVGQLLGSDPQWQWKMLRGQLAPRVWRQASQHQGEVRSWL